MSLFRTKSIEQIRAESEATGEHTLKRALGPVNLVTLGIGAIIGAGIFVLTGNAAAAHAGPAIILSMVLAGFASALAGLCYAEFASTVPIAGSAYTYGYATLGEFVAWIIGWDLVLEYAFGAATVAVGWSGYVVSFLHHEIGIDIPQALTVGPWNTLPDGSAGMFNLPAALITLLVTWLLVVGIQESANVNSAIVIVKVAVVLLVIVSGIWFVSTANLHPFIPANTGKFGEFGWSGILRGAGQIFFAYIGFDAVSTAAQEARNPQKDMPVGILGSLTVCTLLYVLLAFVMVGLVSYTQLGSPAPMAVAIDAAKVAAQGSAWAGLLNVLPFLVKIGAIAGLSSVMLVMMLGQTRVLFSMSNDGLLPEFARRIHPRFRTPYITTIATGLFVAVFAGLVPIKILGELVSIGTLLAFVIVSLGIIALRKNHPNLERPFKTPMVPFIPILSAVVSFGLMLGLPLDTWIRLFVWMAVGFFLYFFYGRNHSKLNVNNPARG